MEQGNLLALPGATWGTKYLEDTSLRRLVLEHYDREHVAIRRYLLFLSVDTETAQEIVQESFLKLHEHLLANDDRTNLRAWLYRVAHNLARNAQMASHPSERIRWMRARLGMFMRPRRRPKRNWGSESG
jgi:hypothetical protein